MSKNSDLNYLDPARVLDSINDGVYVTDCNRRIVYWSRSAQRITGWTSEDIAGRCCHEGILCHEDKDGHRLCGKEHCPLHRSMVTGESSNTSIVVFAKAKDGKRVPMKVSVAPVRAADGTIIGGVETFRDLSAEMHDVERAARIHQAILAAPPLDDNRIAVRTYCIPQDIVGGDYYAASQLDDDRCGFMLADVCGHGVSAALYTVVLRSLWDAHRRLLPKPAQFAAAVSLSLSQLIGEEQSFATAICGVADLARNQLCIAGAGGPEPLLFSSDGCRNIPCSGLPLGLSEDVQYTETYADFGPGDCLLLFTDGAIEVTGADGIPIGEQGLMQQLERLGYPQSKATFKQIEECLLRDSNRIRFDDDLSFMEIRRPK